VSAHEASAAAAKGELRRELARRRAALAPAARRFAAEAVAERVLASPELAGARGVFCCLSFGDELDTWGLVENLAAEGRELYVPRTERGDTVLHVHRWPAPLVRLSFGLAQPRADAPELAAEEIDAAIDVALVAGVGFDRDGYRLGYGAGYFDRFLAGRRFPALGLAFAAQVVVALPREAHDVPMRAVLTERERIEGRPA
jgi:5-formyltetrahydrofolate cyclo-ligase